MREAHLHGEEIIMRCLESVCTQMQAGMDCQLLVASETRAGLMEEAWELEAEVEKDQRDKGQGGTSCGCGTNGWTGCPARGSC